MGSRPTISMSSPHTRKTPMAAAWCCHLETSSTQLWRLAKGLVWKLTMTTLMMMPHWTQFSQLRK